MTLSGMSADGKRYAISSPEADPVIQGKVMCFLAFLCSAALFRFSLMCKIEEKKNSLVFVFHKTAVCIVLNIESIFEKWAKKEV